MFRHISSLRSIAAITVRSRRAFSSTAKPVSAATAVSTGDDRPNLDVTHLKHPTKVPQQPHISDIDRRQRQSNQPGGSRITVDDQTVQLLERLSLVDLDSKEAHRTLEDSIEFASRILTIDTDGVEPLYTVLEKQKLALREDVVSDGNIQEDVLSNARITEEEYFVAPPGNIPLEQDSSGKHKK